ERQAAPRRPLRGKGVPDHAYRALRQESAGVRAAATRRFAGVHDRRTGKGRGDRVARAVDPAPSSRIRLALLLDGRPVNRQAYGLTVDVMSAPFGSRERISALARPRRWPASTRAKSWPSTASAPTPSPISRRRAS